MSSKSFTSFFIFSLVTLHVLTNSVSSVPIQKVIVNSTRKISNNRLNSIHSLKKSTDRNGRFLGKLSVVAGVGLPQPNALPIKREDLLFERAPAQFTASYNYPVTQWGPYIAAVYEPISTLSFVQNPLGYLATVFNPFNWFSGTYGTTTPDNVPTQTAATDKNQNNGDIFVVLDNNQDRKMSTSKVELTTELKRFADEKRKGVIDAVTAELLTKIKNVTSSYNHVDKNIDLIAEETTIKLIEDRNVDKNVNDESRQLLHHHHHHHHRTTSTKTPSISTITATMASTRTTSNGRLTTQTQNLTSGNIVTTLDSSEITQNQSSESNSGEINTSATITTTSTTTASISSTTTNQTSSTPQQNNTFYPNFHNGYYYDGFPQNVSHVVFTTPISTSDFQNSNDVNRIYEQPSVSYYNYDPLSQLNLDYYRQYEQLPPIHEYSNNEFATNDLNNLNGFKPSFPYHH